MEKYFGSKIFILLVFLSAILANIVTIPVSYVFEAYFHDPSYISRCTVGISGRWRCNVITSALTAASLILKNCGYKCRRRSDVTCLQSLIHTLYLEQHVLFYMQLLWYVDIELNECQFYKWQMRMSAKVQNSTFEICDAVNVSYYMSVKQ